MKEINIVFYASIAFGITSIVMFLINIMCDSLFGYTPLIFLVLQYITMYIHARKIKHYEKTK